MPRRGSGQAKKLSGIDLGKRLKYLRQDKKISVKDLAEGAGVQESYIKQLELGCKTPSFETLIRIINTLQITADELLCDYMQQKMPEMIESQIGRMVSDIPKDVRDRIEAHILLDIQLSDKSTK